MKRKAEQHEETEIEEISVRKRLNFEDTDSESDSEVTFCPQAHKRRKLVENMEEMKNGKSLSVGYAKK